MTDIFLHGLETQESDAGNPRFVNTIDSGVIYLVGTAPGRAGLERWARGPLGSGGRVPDREPP